MPDGSSFLAFGWVPRTPEEVQAFLPDEAEQALVAEYTRLRPCSRPGQARGILRTLLQVESPPAQAALVSLSVLNALGHQVNDYNFDHFPYLAFWPKEVAPGARIMLAWPHQEEYWRGGHTLSYLKVQSLRDLVQHQCFSVTDAEAAEVDSLIVGFDQLHDQLRGVAFSNL